MSAPTEHFITDKIVMDSGSATDLIKNNDWPALALKMQKTYLPIQQGLAPEDQASYMVPICTVYYAYERQRVIFTGGGDLTMGKTNVDTLVDLLEEFMEQNGQWKYIKQQSWYTKREYVIGIDINYYPDRSGFTAFIAFHKDTEGNNIFVNLIFDNDAPIEATEWYFDIGEPSTQRRKWQQQLLPGDYLEQLERMRAVTRDQVTSSKVEVQVTGGVSPHKYTFVSWMDDLIWHSTPNGKQRAEYGDAAALRAYNSLDTTVDTDFSFIDDKLKARILGWEILGTMAESSDTGLYRWLKAQSLEMQDLGLEKSKEAWKALYRNTTGGTEGSDRFLADAQTRALRPWRITQSYTEANTADPRTPGSETIRETPALLSRLRRANSFGEAQMEIRKVRAANKGKARAFVRTWVRILKSDDQELAKNNIVFEPLST